jgi:hypothetical protein
MDIVTCPSMPDYGATRDGRVFRVTHYRGAKRQVPFELKSRVDAYGYLMVGASLKAHRIVALTFLPNPENHRDVAHWDGNRQNNRVDNLRWASIADNHSDKHRHGTAVFGEKSVIAKLTEAEVREARVRARRGESHASIAEDMPVDRSVLSRAIRGDTWRHV